MTAKQISVDILLSVNLGDYYDKSEVRKVFKGSVMPF